LSESLKSKNCCFSRRSSLWVRR